VADILYDKQFYRRTVALEPIVKIQEYRCDDQIMIHTTLPRRRRV
jgi:hypothetical protein